jgi:hypothetical protein
MIQSYLDSYIVNMGSFYGDEYTVNVQPHYGDDDGIAQSSSTGFTNNQPQPQPPHNDPVHPVTTTQQDDSNDNNANISRFNRVHERLDGYYDKHGNEICPKTMEYIRPDGLCPTHHTEDCVPKQYYEG